VNGIRQGSHATDHCSIRANPLNLTHRSTPSQQSFAISGPVLGPRVVTPDQTTRYKLLTKSRRSIALLTSPPSVPTASLAYDWEGYNRVEGVSLNRFMRVMLRAPAARAGTYLPRSRRHTNQLNEATPVNTFAREYRVSLGIVRN
jgi:hypothetical protein